MRKRLKITLSIFLILSVLCGCRLFPSREDGKFYLVIDAGHGGNDPGACYGDINEKDINLSVSMLIRDQLKSVENMVVVMTRDTDKFIELADRAECANRHQADLFVSIHSNALADRNDYSGIFTFYHPNKQSDSDIAQLFQDSVCKTTGAINRGILTADYAVLRRTNMPAVLIEIGFMSCPDELTLLQTDEYQHLLAKGITEGIMAYVQAEKE